VSEHYDVIIVGTGAGGGTLAHTLAPSGKRILLLERGDFLPREMDNWNPGSVFVDGKYISADTWYDAVGMAQHHVLDKNFYMNMSIPIAGVAHQAGTCRFGDDPATSVLDVNCKAHELDNLYVVDTSFFPSIGAVNPALTAMANAIRVGEHLLSRMS
jgi:choline dehydrogenase-like flavoprotein